jgi:hypothetical protein
LVVPGVAEFGGTPHRRTAFAADPDRHPLLNRARLEKHIRETGVFTGEAGILVGPQLTPHGDRLIGDRAALVERLGADRFEFLLAPADADPQVKRPSDKTSIVARIFAVSTGGR